MKTGLVIEGGSLRSAFSFGVLKTWADAGVTFPFTAAVGLGGLAAAYFRAGQGDALAVVFPGSLLELWRVLKACVTATGFPTHSIITSAPSRPVIWRIRSDTFS